MEGTQASQLGILTCVMNPQILLHTYRDFQVAWFEEARARGKSLHCSEDHESNVFIILPSSNSLNQPEDLCMSLCFC